MYQVKVIYNSKSVTPIVYDFNDKHAENIENYRNAVKCYDEQVLDLAKHCAGLQYVSVTYKVMLLCNKEVWRKIKIQTFERKD